MPEAGAVKAADVLGRGRVVELATFGGKIEIEIHYAEIDAIREELANEKMIWPYDIRQLNRLGGPRVPGRNLAEVA